MQKKQLIFALVVFILFFVFQLALAPKADSFSSYDSGNYCLAFQDYDIEIANPHLPGYYLYVNLLGFANQVTGSYYYSILLFSIFSYFLGNIFLYLSFRRILEHRDSLLFTLIITLNSLFLYWSSITENYAFDVFFASIILYLATNRKTIYYMFPMACLLGGFRLTSLVLLTPMMAYALFRHFNKFKQTWYLLSSLIIGIIVFFLWFVPMANTAGGVWDYIALYTNSAPVPTVNRPGSLNVFLRNLTSFTTNAIYYFIPTILSLIYLLFNRKSDKSKITTERSFIVLILWIFLPQLGVYTLIHYSKAYLMLAPYGVVLLPLVLFLKHMIDRRFLYFMVGFQLVFFFAMPHKVPDDSGYFNHKSRRISQPAVVWDRTISHYSMSYGHLRYFETLNDDAMAALDKARQLGIRKVYSDPCVDISHRVLQHKYPKMEFMRVIDFDTDKFHFYSGTKQRIDSGFKSLDDYAVLSTTTFTNDELIKFSNIIYQGEILTLSIPYEGYRDSIYNVFKEFYDR
jgi:hypothetical protein